MLDDAATSSSTELDTAKSRAAMAFLLRAVAVGRQRCDTPAGVDRPAGDIGQLAGRQRRGCGTGRVEQGVQDEPFPLRGPRAVPGIEAEHDRVPRPERLVD